MSWSSILYIINKINKSVALQHRRVKTDRQVVTTRWQYKGALWLAMRLSLNLNFSFLNRILLLLIQVPTQLSSRGWVDPVPDPILPEKFLGYSRESNPRHLGWQSDMLTIIPNRRSLFLVHALILNLPLDGIIINHFYHRQYKGKPGKV